MFKQLTALTTVLFTLTLSSSLVSASPLGSSSAAMQPDLVAQNRPIRKGKGSDNFMKQLNLSSQQQQQLTAIRQKYDGQMRQIGEQLRKNQEELRTMMDGTASANAISAKHDQVLGLRQQLDKLRFQSMLESREVLTPEQRKQFSQMMSQRWAKMRSQKGDRLSPDMPPQP